MLANLLRPILSSFHSFSKSSWLATTYTLGSAIAQPVSAQLVEVFGRRKMLFVCNVILAVGTLMAGLAHNLWMLLLARVIQGWGGGGVNACVCLIENDLVSVRQRALVEGMGNVFFGVTLAMGGLYGGAVNDSIGWRWAFLIQVPVIAFAAVAGCFIKVPKRRHAPLSLRKFDISGATLVVGCLVLLQLGLNTGIDDAWIRPQAIASLIVAGVMGVAFMVWGSKRAKEPIIPVPKMLNRPVGGVILAAFFANASFFGTQYMLPIYLQAIDYTPFQSGLRFIHQAIGIAVGSMIFGIVVAKSGVHLPWNLLAQMLMVASVGLFVSLDLHSSSWRPYVYLGLNGFGMGAFFSTSLIALLSVTPKDDRGKVTASLHTLTAIAQAVGLAVATATLNALFAKDLETQHPSGRLVDVSKGLDLLYVADLAVKTAAQHAVMSALRGVFWLTLALSVATIASTIMQGRHYRVADI